MREFGPKTRALVEEVASQRFFNALQADGGLDDLGWYLRWRIGESTATLDGDFTAAELRAIADHMDQHTLK